MLRDIQGLSTEEASAVLRVKPQTLKSRLHRGRLMLREHLADFAGGVMLHSRESCGRWRLQLAAWASEPTATGMCASTTRERVLHQRLAPAW